MTHDSKVFSSKKKLSILIYYENDIEDDDATMVSEDLTPFDCIFMGSL